MEMKLADEPFSLSENGEKTVEIRLNDEKRRNLEVGDEICFRCLNESSKRLNAKVIALYLYPSFKALLSSDLYDKCGCRGWTVDSATESMYKYYTKEEEQKYGVLGIEIELI